ncbi:pyruvate synthase subunit PorB [Methanococcus voltae]|uniref:Pyruvate ferredoxin oxidoreductase beta subunit n=2 Tax=Methanococcus voltae TaxID=2188 RepID=A0A8J7RMD7_METVO|nr:pyruvate synthase subunit PorB [Methanococcus voltae]MBP2172144.1 pyruvate ferredoxin oxidoreductase beta subunit [Methanococcus voltae]MBP2200899.1 pyruvate ferredoxin oxidoreductase beta subunit [Methanococcus voltae]MCS3921623.1 pyruvate ferredoxin oxidoreductase beta subunit [Methanococcus voltae PS]
MARQFPREELFAPGHRGCAGCGAAIVARLTLKAAGKNTIVANATGCLEVMTTPYPETAWRVPWMHVAFENAAAVASGIEAAVKSLKRKRGLYEGEKVNVIAFGGDGGTADIGFQALSGAMERGHDMVYIMYDNEAYMNTGVQRSGSTPYMASTTTSPAGSVIRGENRPKKNMPMIMAAHGIPYVATASISYPEDFMNKVKKACEIDGPAFIQILQPCTTGWGYPAAKTVELGRLAVKAGIWPLYEIENGEYRVTYKPSKRISIEEYLKTQKRYRHLTEEDIEEMQNLINHKCQEMGI